MLLTEEVIEMNRLISKCPVCHGTLQVTTLQCPDCGMELRKTFDLSAFNLLDCDQFEFLTTFLKNRGNLKEVQSDMQLSYPAAKKKLDELLAALHLSGTTDETIPKEVDVSRMNVDYTSTRASEIIKAKLKAHGGHVTVYTARGLPCEIYAEPDGTTFTSDKLPVKPAYDYKVFDDIVELLIKQGGRARKGNGRNYKLGEPGCEENTVVGTIALHRGRTIGESVFDPVFVMAAILEWAGIAENGRGELILADEYKEKL